MLSLNGSIQLFKNSADNGGAISLTKGSIIKTDDKLTIDIDLNFATNYGGGIYVDDAGLWEETSYHNCFIQPRVSTNCTISFEGNEAEFAGSALFGGWIDFCFSQNITSYFHFSYQSTDSELSVVSANPSRICFCRNSVPDCPTLSQYIKLFPGQTFSMQAVAVGQRFGVVPAIVRAVTDTRDYDVVNSLQKFQDTGRNCTTLRYTIQSPRREEILKLTVDKHYIPKVVQGHHMDSNNILLEINVTVELKKCSLGFIFDSAQNICACHPDLLKAGVHCNIDTHTITRRNRQWIHVSPVEGIIVHNSCPLDYCLNKDIALNLTIPDEQCAFNRSGILCGKCQEGSSQVLGTSKCSFCSNTWLLLVVVFALAGVCLVVCLTSLDFTVSTGTINGLIFYANIIRANTAAYFPGKEANTFLSWFVAWLNLDLGIETCLYNGLSAYAKTWLQFVFPVYIWLLVSFIIISSHYSSKVSRLCGNNAIQVLATLFLLSYAKLLRVTITIIQPIQLVYADGSERSAWQYDANVEYLRWDHALLFAAAMTYIILLFVPFTLIVFGYQWLQQVSHHKLLLWVNKFKPLFDAYTGPYKDKHRYWTGLLLLTRIILFTVFSLNTTGDPALNLLAINVVIVCHFFLLTFVGGVYKKKLLNLLENFFLLNLVITSSAGLYTSYTNNNIKTVSVVSVSITLTIASCIFISHCLMKLLQYKRMDATNLSQYTLRGLKFFPQNPQEKPNGVREHNDSSAIQHVTYSVVQLNEPLIGE